MVFFDNCIFKSVGLKPEYHLTFFFCLFFSFFPFSFLLGASFCLIFFFFCRLIFVERVSYGGGGCEGAGCSGDNSFKRFQEIFPVNDSIPFNDCTEINTLLERNLSFCAFFPI